MGHDGDNLVTVFQCNLCHFRNLLKQDPIETLAQDIQVLKLIRQANLDAFGLESQAPLKGI